MPDPLDTRFIFAPFPSCWESSGPCLALRTLPLTHGRPVPLTLHRPRPTHRSVSETSSQPAAPRTAIVIPTRNRPGDLLHSVEHLLPLLDDELHLVIVDDASTEPAQHDALDRLGAADHVHVLRLHDQHGCTRARRAALGSVASAYAIFFDDDSCFERPDRAAIDEIERRFEADPTLAVQALPTVVPWRPAGASPVPGRFTSEFINCGCAVRLDAYHQVGGYSTTMFSPYGEEHDLAIRLLDAGWHIRQFDGPVVIHRETPEARSRLRNSRGRVFNYLRFAWRYLPAWMALPYGLRVVATLLANRRRYEQSARGILLGVLEFCRSAARGLPRHPVQTSTLKLFYGLRWRTVLHLDEHEALRTMSWRQIMFARLRAAEAEATE